MKLKDTLPLLFASIFGAIANIGDLFSNIIVPIRDNFSSIQISSSALVLILFSACMLFFYLSLEKSTKSTPFRLKVTKYILITSLCFSLIFSIVLILPHISNSGLSSARSKIQKNTAIDKEIELANIRRETAKFEAQKTDAEERILNKKIKLEEQKSQSKNTEKKFVQE